MFDRPIHFTVAGRKTTDDDMLVRIASEYADLFEGHEFKTREDFDLARMHANCAAEAQYYRRPWQVEEYERDLKRVLAR